MPRQGRIDYSGVIHHVIVRGIERRKIFLDENDNHEFLERLERVLRQTGCKCYAWALMSNHFHLLVRTGDKSLSDLMRSLQTGYAIYFNRRHRRSGYVYQNRYKSILCQEDTYFLELVRYIHLNPLRAKVLQNLSELDRYPWTGHATLMGRRRRDWQSMDEVLVQFGKQRRGAVRGYREFVRQGLDMGRREDLMGGGLKRSAGGWEGIGLLRGKKDFWRGDERILGDGDFVSDILKRVEETLQKKERMRRDGWDLDRLVEKVCRLKSVKPDDIGRKARTRSLSAARGLIAHWGYHELGIRGPELTRILGISRPALSKAIKRGEECARNERLRLTS